MRSLNLLTFKERLSVISVHGLALHEMNHLLILNSIFFNGSVPVKNFSLVYYHTDTVPKLLFELANKCMNFISGLNLN